MVLLLYTVSEELLLKPLDAADLESSPQGGMKVTFILRNMLCTGRSKEIHLAYRREG